MVVGLHQSHKDIARSAIHLCNNSIQRRLKNDKERSPLLPCHNMWTSTRFQEYLQKRGRGGTWGSIIYPSMKRAVTNAMRVAQDHVEARKNSFELYGADFILGRDFKPWLIEINSSPTMHPSTPVTAQLCAQVQEDTIKVVVDRKLDRNCDIGNFELLWRQVRTSATLLRLSVYPQGGWAWAPGWQTPHSQVPGWGWGHKSCLGLDEVVLASCRTVRSLALPICPKLILLCAPSERFTLDTEVGQPCGSGPMAFII